MPFTQVQVKLCSYTTYCRTYVIFIPNIVYRHIWIIRGNSYTWTEDRGQVGIFLNVRFWHKADIRQFSFWKIFLRQKRIFILVLNIVSFTQSSTKIDTWHVIANTL